MTAAAPDRKPYSAARLAKPAAASYLAFYEEPHLARERRQFAQFIAVDKAQAVMLAERGIIDRAQAAALLGALAEIEALGAEGLPTDARYGSLLLQIEGELVRRVGIDTGGRIHTGRSRLDQGPAARRLYKRESLLRCLTALLPLQRALLARAAEHADAIMPGYTCLQHAHPGTFGHYLLGFCEKLHDDHRRLAETFARVNRSPLGASGLSGTSWPIDRDRTAALLGFEGLVENARIAREAYYAAEIAGGLSLLMSTLNDLATDLHVWSSYEFGLVQCDDSFCGTSSLFPQKRNPAALEAVRFAAGESVTWLSTALATFRGEGTGDVSMREVPLLDRAFDAVEGSLELMAELIATLHVDEGRMATLAGANWSTASALADELVRLRGLSYREAHSVVGRLVRGALEAGRGPGDVTGADIDAAAMEALGRSVDLPDEIARGAFDTRSFVASRTSKGGVAPAETRRLAALAAGYVADEERWLASTRGRLDEAGRLLDEAARGLIAGP